MRTNLNPDSALHGLRVLVTRPLGRSDVLARLLRRRGARVLALPAVRIAPPADRRALDAAARALLAGDFETLLFTSANGVASFFASLRGAAPKRAVRLAALKRLRVAAVGPATAAALRREGVRSAAWPAEHRAEALAASLKVRRGERILLPQAAGARPLLARALRRKGAQRTAVEAYRTAAEPASGAKLRRLLLGPRPPDWITFTSASTVESVAGLLSAPERRKVFASCRTAVIGPVTGRALLKTGTRPTATAASSTAEGLAEAIVLCAT